MIQPTFSRRDRYLTLAAGVIGSATSSGAVGNIIFGLTLKEIADDFTWSRSAISIALSCFFFFNGVGAIWLGQLAARHGPRRPAIVFSLAFAATLAAISALPGSLALFIISFMLLGVSGGGCTSMPYAIGIAGWFDRHRGLALAIAVSGVGLGHLVVPGYAHWLWELNGWRAVYMGASVYVAVLALIALIGFFREPPVQRRNGVSATVPIWQIYRESREIRLIAVAIFLFSFASIGLSVNLPVILADRSFSMGDAALMLSIYGGANWLAKLGTGVLLDRHHVRYVSGAIFIATSIACAMLLSQPSLAWCVVAACLVGVGVGAEADIMTYAASRYYHPRLVASAIGAVWVLMPWGAGLGVMSAGVAHDLTGSNRAILGIYLVCAACAAVAVLRLGAYRDGESDVEAAEA